MNLTWNVFVEDINRKEIKTYNIFNHTSFNKDVQKALENSIIKEDFAEKLKKELFYYFGSRAEWEVVLTSWPPYVNKDELRRMNTEFSTHEAKYHNQLYKINVCLDVGKKIDVYNQVMLNWEVFVNYIWENK